MTLNFPVYNFHYSDGSQLSCLWLTLLSWQVHNLHDLTTVNFPVYNVNYSDDTYLFITYVFLLH